MNGGVDPEVSQDDLEELAWRLGSRLGAVLTERESTYDLTVEEDVLLGANLADDPVRLGLMLRRVAEEADQLEQQRLPGLDQPLQAFRSNLTQEGTNAS